MGGPSSCPAGCQAPVIAFPALSPHSRAHDVFWVSVCLLSEAKPTFLNSHCSVHAEESKGPSLLGGEVTLPLQHSHFWSFSPLGSSTHPFLPRALSPLKHLCPDRSAVPGPGGLRPAPGTVKPSCAWGRVGPQPEPSTAGPGSPSGVVVPGGGRLGWIDWAAGLLWGPCQGQVQARLVT